MKDPQIDPVYKDLVGKIVVVTGGSSGIGLATVKRFLKEGCYVYNLDISPPQEDNASKYIKCDVSLVGDVKNAIMRIGEQEGRIDVVVCNAGIEEYYMEHELPEEVWDRVVGVNLKGAFLVTKYSISYLLKSDYPSIAYTSSIQGVSMVQKRNAPYVVSKHGLIGLMRSVAVNYAPKLRSNAVCPGPIITPLQVRNAAREVGDDPVKIKAKLDEWGRVTALGRQGLPEEVANVFVFLASKEASYITGACIVVDGGKSILNPQTTPRPNEFKSKNGYS